MSPSGCICWPPPCWCIRCSICSACCRANNPGENRAVIAIGIYLVLGLIALLVDRRALLVSALGYVMFALSTVLKASGVIGQDLTYTALVAGAALLLLSAFWHRARQVVMMFAPAGLRRMLPPV